MGALISAFIAAATDFISWLLSSGSTKSERNRFTPVDGITLYDCVGSPCARRVRMKLLAKGIKWHTVGIDLLGGEQKSDDYLKINPQGKVPAVTFKNVKNIPDCILVESAVITEFLDVELPGETTLYPTESWARTQVKMWLDWEQSLSEDFFPVVSNNYLPFLIRLIHRSRDGFISSLPKNIPKNIRQKNINLYDGISWKSEEQLKLCAIGCYRGLLKIEKALEGQEFLVAGRLTMADLAVYSRLSMYDLVGLPIAEKDFPNTYAYLTRLANLPFIHDSMPIGVKFISFLFSYLPCVPVFIGNLKAGKSHTRFDGSHLIERVLGEDVERRSFDHPLPEIPANQVVLFDYICSPECWQTQLLLYEKGQSFKTVESDFLETVGRPHGSEGIFRIQRGDRVVTGRRAQLEYLDLVLPGRDLIPTDHHLRARVQMWQAWEELMHTAHIYPLMETTLLPSMFKDRFTPDQGDDLLRLRSDAFYSIRFPEILRVYTQRWEAGSDVLRQLSASVGINVDRDPDMEEQSTLEHHWELHRCLEHLDGQLAGQDYLVGGQLTLADICVYCRLLLMPYISMKISGQKYPNVARWMTSLWEREAFRIVATQVTENLDRFMMM